MSSYSAPAKAFRTRSRRSLSATVSITYSKTTAASSEAVMQSPEDFDSPIVRMCLLDASCFASAAARFITFRPSFVSARAINKNVIIANDVCGFNGNCGIQAGICSPRMKSSTLHGLLENHHTASFIFKNSRIRAQVCEKIICRVIPQIAHIFIVYLSGTLSTDLCGRARLA